MRETQHIDRDVPAQIDPELFSQEAEEERRRAHFRDYLVAPLIAGKQRRVEYQARIRAEDVQNTGAHVEIANVRTDEESQTHEHKGGVVSVERDADGEIKKVYVECTCGDKIVLNFVAGEEERETTENGDQDILAEETLDGGDVDGLRITRGDVDEDRIIN